MGGFLLLPEDELILIAHLLDAEGLTLLASDDLADGPQELDVLTGPLSLPTPPRPNTDPTEPPHFTFWAHQLGPLRPWADAPQPTTFSERVHRLVNEESVPDFESLLDDERSPILRWSRASWHDSGALCPGLLQGQARPSAQVKCCRSSQSSSGCGRLLMIRFVSMLPCALASEESTRPGPTSI